MIQLRDIPVFPLSLYRMDAKVKYKRKNI